MYKTLTPIFAALILFGCNASPEEFSTTQEQEMAVRQAEYTEMEEIAKHPQRSIEDAIEIAIDAFHNERPMTRTAHLRQAINVETLSLNGPNSVRGSKMSDVDSSVFVCNLGHNDGFVLVSGDRRVPEMLAYVPSGSLHLDSISDNHPLLLFLNRLSGYFSENKAKFEKRRKLLSQREKGEKRERFKPCPKEPGGNPYGESIKWESDGWKDQKTPAKMLIWQQWGQGYPYNQFAPIVEGEKACAGCVAVAVAQLMAYHKHPRAIDYKYFNWKLINQERKSNGIPNTPYDKEVATLIYKIGMKLHNSWGARATGAPVMMVPSVLKECGYYVHNNFWAYNDAMIQASIKLHQPILVSAYATKTTEKTGFWIFNGSKIKLSQGHTWIIDGYLPQIETHKLVGVNTHNVYQTKQEERLLVHCNWGWNSDCNGFFCSGVFDAYKNRITDFNKDGERITRGTSEDPYNFQYKITILPFTTPCPEI